MKVKVAYLGVGEEPRIVECDGSLESLQGLVGGLIEPFDVLFGTTPSIYVNEEGLLQGLKPNRAVYATAKMVEEGYLSQADFSRVAMEGELYQVLHGPVVAVSYEEDPETGDVRPRDITEAEFEALCAEIGDAGSGAEARALLAMCRLFGGWPRRESGKTFVDATISVAA